MDFFKRVKAGLLFLLFILVPASCLAQNEDDFDKTKVAVTVMLKRVMDPNTCNTWRSIAAQSPSDENQRNRVIFCDSDFDFTKPLVFSEMIRKQKSDGPYVCGIVSGTTSYGRKMGARFIVDDTYDLVLKVKLSKKPILYWNKDRYLREVYAEELAGFNKLYKETCE